MIILPSWPGARSAVPRELDYGGFSEPGGGAEVQRINRKGNRYAMAITMPPLDNNKLGRIWVNRLIKGRKEGARIEYPLLDFDPGTPNLSNETPIVVDGVGHAGTSLAVMNLHPGYAFFEGQPFSLEISGQHYFDFLAEPAIVSANGKVTLSLTQELRKPPIAGSVLHVAKPMIEGFVRGDPLSWELALRRTVELSFELHETR